jgi:pimeloyl-ACP methyl ester carboxylesterase
LCSTGAPDADPVVHDIGGPIGFELAAVDPDRVRSLKLLKTIVAVESFHPPWMMEPFAHRGVGEQPTLSRDEPAAPRPALSRGAGTR